MRTAECERARSWASLALDDELSEIEQASLRAHLGRCAACARFEGDLDALTRELRAAPPERPAVVVMLPRRRSGVVRGLQFGSAAAAAVMLAAGLGSLAGSLSSRNTVTLTTASPSGNFGVLFDRGLDRGGIVAMAPTQRLPASRIHRPVAL